MFVKGEHERQFAYEAHTVCDNKGWTIVNKKDTKRERLRRNHLLKSQFFFVGSQVSI
jgi:hypothetical protein